MGCSCWAEFMPLAWIAWSKFITILNMAIVTLAKNAMATRFEVVLHGEDPVSLRSAGEEALAEIERIEACLSLFRPDSEIAHVNSRAALEPVKVTPEVFALLQRAQRISLETAGAFDITIAPLLRCWGFLGGGGSLPQEAAIERAREIVGLHLVRLDSREFTVRFERSGVMLDLGAIGKGYAIERAAELLREAGVGSALLHGGTSTVYGLGCPPGADSWQVAIETETLPAGGQYRGASVALRDEALSVSAVWGKFFEWGGEVYGHVLDPGTGRPARECSLAAVVLPMATETDALSTALLTRGAAVTESIKRASPGARMFWVSAAPGGLVQAWPGPREWGLSGV